jgi:hypothetical protein
MWTEKPIEEDVPDGDEEKGDLEAPAAGAGDVAMRSAAMPLLAGGGGAAVE